jgi:hypothetical protein
MAARTPEIINAVLLERKNFPENTMPLCPEPSYVATLQRRLGNTAFFFFLSR